MITFVIIGSGIEKTYEYSPDVNINKLKLDIIKDFELSCEYIDLNITIERPIRVLGKFNMERGYRDKASKDFQRSFEISSKLNEKTEISEDYRNLGNLAFSNGKREEAEELYLKALKLHLRGTSSFLLQ